MSFFGDIANGVTGFVKDVFNIDDEPARERPKPDAPRSRDLAVDSRTTYERPRRTGGDASSTAGSRTPSFSLLDTINARSAAASVATPTPVQVERSAPPHVTGDRTTTPLRGGTTSAARAVVRDASTGATYGSVEYVGSMDRDAASAAINVQRGLDYFAEAFGRNGLDGAGSGVEVLINDRSTDADGNERFQGNGGYFATEDGAGGVTEAIHFGTGTSYRADRGLVEQGAMLHADDLTIHELTHGLIRKETGHLGGDTGTDEAGATNEAIADVIAAAATRDWRIGEGMYTERSDYKAMRDIANPEDPTAVHGLWRTMSEVERARAEDPEGEVEEHWASGVISTAANRVQQRLGGEAGWQAVEQVFYDTIDNARLGDMSFQAVAAALRTSAAALYGDGSAVDAVFDEELRRAGL